MAKKKKPARKPPLPPTAETVGRAVRLCLSAALKKWREEANLTQKAAAPQVGLDQSTIARMETGKQTVTFEQVVWFHWVYKGDSYKNMPDELFWLVSHTCREAYKPRSTEEEK